MPITTLDPRTALIVIDLQEGILGLAKVHPGDEIVTNAIRIIETFRKNRLPVVLVNVAGGAPGGNEQGPARGTNPAGIATSIGVESTVRQAHAHSITRIFPRLGETGATEEVISLLKDRS